jgi:hypothetical protein
VIANSPSRRATIRQHDVTRLLRAARAAGLEVFGYEIDFAACRITVNTIAPAKQTNPDADLNWWLEKHGQKIYGNK